MLRCGGVRSSGHSCKKNGPSPETDGAYAPDQRSDAQTFGTSNPYILHQKREKLIMRKAFTIAMVCVCALTITTSMFAQIHKHTTPNPVRIPSQEAPAGLVTLFSNLGPTATNNYYAADGWVVSGSSAADFAEQWIAIPFIPKANSPVTRIQAALTYISGTNKFIVGIYNDNGSNAPGTRIAQYSLANAPAFGTCCTLVSKAITGAGVAVQAGKTYWLVINSNDQQAPDFEGVWDWSNEYTSYNAALAGWSTFEVGDNGVGESAAGIFGTTP